MTRSAEREEAYAAVDGERDYQNQAWGYGEEAYPLTVGEFVLLLEEYAARARREWVANREPVHNRADAGTLRIIRKVAALAVGCMEQHGAPHRKGFERDSNPVTRASLDTRALRVEVEGVRRAGKDIRQQVVWVKYGIEGARHELRMPYGDARELRRLLMDLRLPCGCCKRVDTDCTPKACSYFFHGEPAGEVR